MTKILTEHLKCRNDIRIYRERPIGGNICDLMVVSDCLEGYELKSDVDDYSRLQKQVKSYDLYFDKNYLVVGASHLNSAKDHVGSHWGIIVVRGGRRANGARGKTK